MCSSVAKLIRLIVTIGVLMLLSTLNVAVVKAGRDGSTNIVLTQDTLVLNENGRKHSNNIVIKDEKHKPHHHCEHKLHLTHHHMHHMQPHHQLHHHQSNHHHRSQHDEHDMHDLASHANPLIVEPKTSDQRSDQWPEGDRPTEHHSQDDHFAGSAASGSEQSFLPGVGNSALNHILGMRYFRPLSVARSELQRTIKFPVYIHDDNQK